MTSEGALCETCLSRDRNLFSVKVIPKRYINELQLRDRICWECRAQIINMVKFRRKASAARRRLTQVEMTGIGKAYIQSISSLSMKVLSPVCIGDQDCQAMADHDQIIIVEGEVENPKLLDQIKEEHSPDVEIKHENDTELLEEIFEAETEQFYQPEVPKLFNTTAKERVRNVNTVETNNLASNEKFRYSSSNLKVNNIMIKRRKKWKDPLNVNTEERNNVASSKELEHSYSINIKKKRKKRKVIYTRLKHKTAYRLKKLQRDQTKKSNPNGTLETELDPDDIENNLIKTFKISKVDGSDSTSVITKDPKPIVTEDAQSRLPLSFLPPIPLVHVPSPISSTVSELSDSTLQLVNNKRNAIEDAKAKILRNPNITLLPKRRASVPDTRPYPVSMFTSLTSPPTPVALMAPPLPPPTAEPVTTRSGRKVRSKFKLNL